MVVNTTDAMVAISSTCTQYTSAEITITVPQAGTVIIWANVMLDIGHTSGTRDNAWVFVENTTTTCNPEPQMAIMVVPSSLPTDGYWQTVSAMKNYTVTSAGTYTFYVTGMMQTGVGGDFFYYADLVAVFYPS